MQRGSTPVVARLPDTFTPRRPYSCGPRCGSCAGGWCSCVAGGRPFGCGGVWWACGGPCMAFAIESGLCPSPTSSVCVRFLCGSVGEGIDLGHPGPVVGQAGDEGVVVESDQVVLVGEVGEQFLDVVGGVLRARVRDRKIPLRGGHGLYWPAHEYRPSNPRRCISRRRSPVNVSGEGMVANCHIAVRRHTADCPRSGRGDSA